MLRSLYSGVSGLTTHQTKMDVIGNNIANVNTYGFKSSSVSFSDLYYQNTKAAKEGTDQAGGVNPSQIGYGTQLSAITKNMSRSSFQSTSSAYDMAIAGEGFLQVQDKAGNTYYTRVGNTKFDSNGNLVDSKGNFILGTMNATPTDATGLSAMAGSTKLKLNVPSVSSASHTQAVGTPTIAGTEYTMAFTKGNQPDPITVTIDVAAATTKDAVVYDKTVSPQTLTFNLTQASALNIKSLTELQAKLNALIEEGSANGGVLDSAGYTAGIVTLTSSATNYAALSDAQKTQVDREATNALMYGAIAAPSPNVGSSTTAIGDPATGPNDIKTEPQFKDNLDSLTISDDGTIIGTHARLGTLVFGRVDLATFVNPEGLDEAGNSYFKATAASGVAKLAVPGYDGSGNLVTSALEMSNVNLSGEFTEMITAQRGFQANARVITTSDSLLEELVNLKR